MHERLRCRLGEVCRLLRQAKLAETELKQVRCVSCMPPSCALISCGHRRQDVLARRQWDRYFTGEETRDVLEVRHGCTARRMPVTAQAR